MESLWGVDGVRFLISSLLAACAQCGNFLAVCSRVTGKPEVIGASPCGDFQRFSGLHQAKAMRSQPMIRGKRAVLCGHLKLKCET